MRESSKSSGEIFSLYFILEVKMPFPQDWKKFIIIII